MRMNYHNYTVACNSETPHCWSNRLLQQFKPFKTKRNEASMNNATTTVPLVSVSVVVGTAARAALP
jgi:hypothetical protein